MMARLIALLLLAWGAPALGRGFENCGKADAKSAGAAIDGSRAMAARAAAAVGDTEAFGTWFGAWSPRAGETVRAGLKAVHRELVADEVVAVCLDGRSEDCKDGTYAYVLYARPRVIHLCPVFFAMPSMADARAGVGDQEDGTREGTIVHELSHFRFVAGTDDHCYSRTECAGMATRDPRLAVANADSFQYFAEDVTLAFWAAGGAE